MNAFLQLRGAATVANEIHREVRTPAERGMEIPGRRRQRRPPRRCVVSPQAPFPAAVRPPRPWVK